MSNLSQQERNQKRRVREAMTAHAMAALIRAYQEPDPARTKIAFSAVAIADAVIQRLEETDPYED